MPNIDPVKLKQFRDLAIQKFPDRAGEIDSFVGEKQQEMYQMGAYQQTGDISVVPEARRAEVIYKAGQQGYTPPATEEQDKAENAERFRNQALGVVNEMQEMEGIEEISGMSGTKWNPRTWFRGTTYQDKKAKFDQLKGMLSLENRKMLKGSGQISDFESQMLADASTALKPEMSDDAFLEELEKIRTVLDPNYEITSEGIVEKETSVPALDIGAQRPEQEGEQGMIKRKIDSGFDGKIMEKSPSLMPEKGENKLYDFFFKNRNLLSSLIADVEGLDIGRDIVSGLIMKGKTGQQLQESIDTSMQVAEAALKRAQEIEDPEKKDYFESVADSLLEDVQANSKNIEETFSESSQENPLWRGAKAGVGIGLTAFSAAKGVDKATKAVGAARAAKKAKPSLDLASKTVKTVEKVKGKGVRPSLRAKKTAELAKSGFKPDTDALIKAAEETATADPAIKKALEAYKPSITNIKDSKTFMERLGYWGANAYKASGDAKAIPKAQMLASLYKNALTQLATEAPDVYKYQRLLGYTYKFPKAGKLISRIVFYGGLGGGLRGLF